MRHSVALALATLFLGSCVKDDDATPPTHPLQGDPVGQTLNIKVKADEWEEHGTPGDDAYGYEVRKSAYLLTEDMVEHGTVQLSVQRGSGNWMPLPMLASEGAPEDMDWSYTYEAGHVRIHLDRNSEAFEAPDHLITFRLVVFSE